MTGVISVLRNLNNDSRPVNPASADANLVRVTFSSTGFLCDPIERLLSLAYPDCRLLTDGCPVESQWIQIELLTVCVRPTAYQLSHYSFDEDPDHYHSPRNWRFEGHDDDNDSEWVVLKEHVDDGSLVGKNAVTTVFDIDTSPSFFSRFRVIQTERNSSGNYTLMVSGIEVYGEWEEREREEDEKDDDDDGKDDEKEDEEQETKDEPVSDDNTPMMTMSLPMDIQSVKSRLCEFMVAFQKRIIGDNNNNSNQHHHHILDDFAFLRSHVSFDPCQFYQQVVLAMGGDVDSDSACDISICPVVRRNARDGNSEEQRGVDALQSIFDAVHVQVMHGFDSGMRVVVEEGEQERNNDGDDGEEEEDDEQQLYDREVANIREQTGKKFNEYINIRMSESGGDSNSNSNSNNQTNSSPVIVSKFVTTVIETAEEEIEDDDDDDEKQTDNDNDNQQHKPKKHLIYSSGHRYQYWPFHKRSGHPWYIPIIFENIKDEVLFNGIYAIIIIAFNKTMEEAMLWVPTDYCKQMVSNGKWTDEYGSDFFLPLIKSDMKLKVRG